MTTRPTRARLLVALALAVAVTACSDDPELADVTTIAPPATADTTAAPTTEPAGATTEATDTTGTTGTTVAATSPDTSASVATDAGTGPAGPMFSDALGVKVDTAPGVNTPGDTRQLLPEGLYVHIAWAADPDDPSVFTVQPDDVEILEAYANAVRTYYEASTTTLTTDSAGFDEYFADGGALFDSTFESNRANYRESLGSGVVLRPYIPADLHAENAVTVLDCYLEDQQWIQDGGVPVLGPLEPRGAVTSMVKAPHGWVVAAIGPEPTACL